MQFKKKQQYKAENPVFLLVMESCWSLEIAAVIFTFYYSLEAAFKGPPKLSRGEVVGWML